MIRLAGITGGVDDPWRLGSTLDENVRLRGFVEGVGADSEISILISFEFVVLLFETGFELEKMIIEIYFLKNEIVIVLGIKVTI